MNSIRLDQGCRTPAGAAAGFVRYRKAVLALPVQTQPWEQ